MHSHIPHSREKAGAGSLTIWKSPFLLLPLTCPPKETLSCCGSRDGVGRGRGVGLLALGSPNKACRWAWVASLARIPGADRASLPPWREGLEAPNSSILPTPLQPVEHCLVQKPWMGCGSRPKVTTFPCLYCRCALCFPLPETLLTTCFLCAPSPPARSTERCSARTAADLSCQGRPWLSRPSPLAPWSPPTIPVKAHRGKEGAEEETGIRVALPGEQGQPADRLLNGLGRSVVVQQVGQPHFRVADIVAQGHGWGDGYASCGAPGGPCSTVAP